MEGLVSGYNRVESFDRPMAKVFGMATGLHSFEEWINLVPDTGYQVCAQQPWREKQASHRCGNGVDGCIGLMCTSMKSRRLNISRNMDHVHAKFNPDDGCICEGGRLTGQLCLMDRTHLNLRGICENLVDIVDPILASQALAHCPTCSQHVIDIDKLFSSNYMAITK